MWFHCTKFLRGDELTLAYAVILSSAVVSQVSLPASISAVAWHELCSSQICRHPCRKINFGHDLTVFWLEQQRLALRCAPFAAGAGLAVHCIGVSLSTWKDS